MWGYIPSAAECMLWADGPPRRVKRAHRAAIGLPDVASAAARDAFYKAANWTYQAGVFLARSSGLVYQARPPKPFVLPALTPRLSGVRTWALPTTSAIETCLQ